MLSSPTTLSRKARENGRQYPEMPLSDVSPPDIREIIQEAGWDQIDLQRRFNEPFACSDSIREYM